MHKCLSINSVFLFNIFRIVVESNQDDRSFISMSKTELKKDRLLECGLSVMKEKGYNGTSVNDIVHAAGIPKGSFYSYFKSKEDFVLKAIELVAAENYTYAQKLLFSSEKEPLKRLQTFFEQQSVLAIEDGFRVGCFMGNMCQEMADNSEKIRLKVKKTLGQTTDLIRNVLEETGISDEELESTSKFVVNAWQGTLLRMKAEKSRDSLDAFLQTLPTLLKQN